MIVYIANKECSLYVDKSYSLYAFLFMKIATKSHISKRNVTIHLFLASEPLMDSEQRAKEISN
jgi:hypothetical protein